VTWVSGTCAIISLLSVPCLFEREKNYHDIFLKICLLHRTDQKFCFLAPLAAMRGSRSLGVVIKLGKWGFEERGDKRKKENGS